jgi:PAS domain S-box-containing protein
VQVPESNDLGPGGEEIGPKCSILHLEDSKKDAALIHDTLRAEGVVCRFVHAQNREEFVAALERGQFDLILADHSLPSFDGMAALELAREKHPEVPFIFLSGTMSEARTDESFRNGAADYVPKKSLSRLGASVRRAIGVIRERGERRRAEEQLKEQAALLDKAQDAILVRDLEHRIIYWNKSAERIFGWTAAEAIGKNSLELISRQHGAEFMEALQTVLTNGEWSGEVRQGTKSGGEVVVESRWTLVRDADGHPKSILVLSTDITEKKKLEAQFLRAQRLESIGTLASGIAHDLNNILAPIMMSVNLLQESITDERDARLLETLRSGVQRGAEMVKQILSFTRGQDGARCQVNLKHVVSEVAKIVRETFPKKIQVQTVVAKNLWSVLADTTQIHQVLMNLCVNARDAMPDGGTLLIEAENHFLDSTGSVNGIEHNALNVSLPLTDPILGGQPNSYLAITVADTGTGIAPEILQQIWEPFFTLKPQGQGTGLGLSTVLNIVKAHGGFIRTESEMGKGTRFRVFLPAAEPTTKPVAPEPTAAIPAGRGENILVVDDERAFQEITKAIFNKYGYRVLTASDGTEAVALFAQHKDDIDLVMTDMVMPYLDGPATINALRRLDPNVRIIASSGLSENETLAHELTNATFLLKPFTTEKLLATVNEVLHPPNLLAP